MRRTGCAVQYQGITLNLALVWPTVDHFHQLSRVSALVNSRSRLAKALHLNCTALSQFKHNLLTNKSCNIFKELYNRTFLVINSCQLKRLQLHKKITLFPRSNFVLLVSLSKKALYQKRWHLELLIFQR